MRFMKQFRMTRWQLAGNWGKGEKIVSTHLDGSEIFLPAAGLGDNNNRRAVNRSLSEPQDFGIFPIGENLLTDDDGDMVSSNTITRFLDACRNHWGDAVEKKFIGKQATNLVVGADDEPNGNIDQFSRSMKQQGKGFAFVAGGLLQGIRGVNGWEGEFALAHDGLPPRSGEVAKPRARAFVATQPQAMRGTSVLTRHSLMKQTNNGRNTGVSRPEGISG
jgi:hypothetical protein